MERNSGKKSKKAQVSFYRKIILGFMIFTIVASVGLAVKSTFKSNEPTAKEQTSSSNDTKDKIEQTTETTEQTAIEQTTTKETKKVYTRKENFSTFLICGINDGNADTIMVAGFDEENGTINVLNVPRDTIVDVDRAIKKINGGYAYGIETLREEVSDLLGIPIDYYGAVNIEGFVDIINAMDGVDFNVPVRMKYDDPVQDLHIDIEPGMQHLNGTKALHVVRFRKCNEGEQGGYANGDIDRINAQQDFVKAVIKKMASPSTLLKLDDIWETTFNNIKTNVTFGKMISLGLEVLKIDRENIDIETMKGEGVYLLEKDYKGGVKLSYFIPDVQGVIDYVNQNINPYTEDITEIKTKDISTY